MVVSVTRLRSDRFFYVFPFAFRAQALSTQALKTTGCRGVWTRKTRGLAFWTLTLWDDERSMRLYVSTPPHRDAIPRLADWCDEAAVTHWSQEPATTPDWTLATQKLAESGRLLRVKHPSPAHKRGKLNVT